MKRLGLGVLLLSSACAGGEDSSMTNPGLGSGPSTSPSTPTSTTEPVMNEQSTGAAGEESTTGEMDPGTSTGAAESSSGANETTGGGASSSSSDTGMTGGGMLGVCDPRATDNVCFMCGRANCCTQIVSCYEDEVCTCSLDCIEDGGRAEECNSMCGGINAPSGNIVLCINSNCDAECDGV